MRRCEFSSLVAALLPQKTHSVLLLTLILFQLAIAICENKKDNTRKENKMNDLISNTIQIETQTVSSKDFKNTYLIKRRIIGSEGKKAVMVMLYPTRCANNSLGIAT